MPKEIGELWGVWGGWSDHEPRKVTEYVGGLAQEMGFRVIYMDTLNAFLDPEFKKRQDHKVVYLSWTNEPGPQVKASRRDLAQNASLNAISLTDEQRDALRAQLLKEADRGNGITPEQMDGLLTAVRFGTGFTYNHGGGGDTFHGCHAYQRMALFQWTDHFGGSVPRHDVIIVNHEHPITCGMEDFVMENTEQYCGVMHPGVDHVLAETVWTGEHDVPGRPSMRGKRMPYAWTSHYGYDSEEAKAKAGCTSDGGRVAAFLGVHSLKDIKDGAPEVAELAMGNLLWAAHLEEYIPRMRQIIRANR